MNHSLSIGNILTRPKLGFIDHMGVVVADNSILHNTPERGEHISTLDEFAAGEHVKIQRTKVNPFSVIANSRRIIPNAKKYDLFGRNCEHTAYEALHGVPQSPKLVALGIILFIALVWLLFRR